MVAEVIAGRIILFYRHFYNTERMFIILAVLILMFFAAVTPRPEISVTRAVHSLLNSAYRFLP